MTVGGRANRGATQGPRLRHRGPSGSPQPSKPLPAAAATAPQVGLAARWPAPTQQRPLCANLTPDVLLGRSKWRSGRPPDCISCASAPVHNGPFVVPGRPIPNAAVLRGSSALSMPLRNAMQSLPIFTGSGSGSWRPQCVGAIAGRRQRGTDAGTAAPLAECPPALNSQVEPLRSGPAVMTSCGRSSAGQPRCAARRSGGVNSASQSFLLEVGGDRHGRRVVGEAGGRQAAAGTAKQAGGGKL